MFELGGLGGEVDEVIWVEDMGLWDWEIEG